MGEIGLANSVSGAGQRPSVCVGRRLPDLSSLSEEWLSAAEEAAQQVVNSVRPTLDSEEKRRDIIDHLQRLVNGRLNCEIFPYGSVPLKTYLPDGDIDLTAIKNSNTEKSLAHEVLAVLQREEKNEKAEFQVRDTQFIDAEVKLVKCLVRNIVIDISFNQLGGLSTLCFLEQIDRLVGRNHLFKRSIILVKTWCYYESRILGAHHGLISTYALETLVLYIFHLFHSSLSGPLAVLYKFLDYYGQFDWENYCVSLKGPVCKSSLPDIVVEPTESGWNNRMLSEEFLENCIEMFSFTSRVLEGNSKAFQVKHLNIIDPLMDNNNLGRSVSRGNLYRIRSAFKYGARRLGQILSGPRYKLVEEINKFFANALARHGNDNRRSNQCLSLEWDDGESFSVSVSSPLEFLLEDGMPLKSSVSAADNDSVGLECKSPMDGELPMGMSFDKHSSVGVVASGHQIKREANGIRTSNSHTRVGPPDFSPSSNGNMHLSWKHSCALPPMPSEFSVQIGSLERNDLHPSDLVGNASHNYSSLPLDTRGNDEVNDTYQWCMDNSQTSCKIHSGPIVKAKFLDHPSVEFWQTNLKSIGGELEVFNPLANLSGDYDSHIRSLLYGQLCHGFSLSASAVYHPPLLPSRHESKHLRDNSSQPVPLPQGQFSDTSSQPLSVKHSMFQAPDYTLPAAAFRAEGTQKNSFTRERPAQGRGRSKVPGKHNQSRRYSHGNGMSHGLGEQSYLANGYHDVLPARSRSQGSGKLNDWCQSPRSFRDRSQRDDCSSGLYKIEFGSFGNLAERLISTSIDCQGSSLDVSPETQGKPAAMKQERYE